MLDDFKMMESRYVDADHLTLYPIGDAHIGSSEFNEGLFRKWVQMVENDSYGAVAIVGDMMDMGLKNSKTNVYEQKLTPMEQKELCYELLKPIKGQIIGGCSGNHEGRNMREVGTNPLYDVFCRLGIEDRYRENGCFIKLQVGKIGRNPNVYGVVLTHGKSKNKDDLWNRTVDGCDCFISGHTHDPNHAPRGKIKMDLIHDVVKLVGYQQVVVQPFLNYGGYGLSGKYPPNYIDQFQRVYFSGTTKKVGYTYY